jgi:hypothetical protein
MMTIAGLGEKAELVPEHVSTTTNPSGVAVGPATDVLSGSTAILVNDPPGVSQTRSRHLPVRCARRSDFDVGIVSSATE